MRVGNDLASRDRIGYITVEAESELVAELKTQKVLDNMEVFDLDGKAIFNRDLYRGEMV